MQRALLYVAGREDGDAMCLWGRALVILQPVHGRGLVRTVIMPAMWCTLTGNMWATGRCLIPPAAASDTVRTQVDG